MPLPNLAWWMWVALGIVLMAAELLTPGGFYLLFFGLGSLVVGLMGALGFVMPITLQLLLFLVFSLVSVGLFRKPLLEYRRGKTDLGDTDTLIGTTGTALSAMKPGEYGKIEMRGTAWNAQNIGVIEIASGARCKVEEADGLTLKVRG